MQILARTKQTGIEPLGRGRPDTLRGGYHTMRRPTVLCTRSCSVLAMSVVQSADAHRPMLGAILATMPPSSSVVERCRLTISPQPS